MTASVFFTYCFYILISIFIISIFIDATVGFTDNLLLNVLILFTSAFAYIISLFRYPLNLINFVLLKFLSFPFALIKHFIPFLDVSYLKMETSLSIYLSYLLIFSTVFFISYNNRRKVLEEYRNNSNGLYNRDIRNKIRGKISDNISNNIIKASKAFIIITKRFIIKEDKKVAINHLQKFIDQLDKRYVTLKNQSKEMFKKLKSFESIKDLNDQYMKDTIDDEYKENIKLIERIDISIGVSEDLLLENENSSYYKQSLLNELDQKEDLLIKRLSLLKKRYEIEKKFNKLLKKEMRKNNL